MDSKIFISGESIRFIGFECFIVLFCIHCAGGLRSFLNTDRSRLGIEGLGGRAPTDMTGICFQKRKHLCDREFFPRFRQSCAEGNRFLVCFLVDYRIYDSGVSKFSLSNFLEKRSIHFHVFPDPLRRRRAEFILDRISDVNFNEIMERKRFGRIAPRREGFRLSLVTHRHFGYSRVTFKRWFLS